MKRIATVGAVITAFTAAPAVAAAGNIGTHVTLQNHRTQVASVYVAKVHRAQAAVSLQRHLVLVAQAQRFSAHLRPQMR